MAAFYRVQRLLLLSFCVILYGQYCRADEERYIADDSYTYRVNYSNGSTCLTMSFNAHIVISYKYINYTNQSHPVSVKVEEFDLPNKTFTNVVNGDCSTDDSYRLLTLSWLQGYNQSEFSLMFNFSLEKKEWYLAQLAFDFELDNTTFKTPKESGSQSYQTTEGVKFFNRTFHRNQYFYCKACKKLFLREQGFDTGNDTGPCFKVENKKENTTYHVCSFIQLSNSVIYPGDVSSINITKKLCLEDFIELQEIIIPSVVGGVLAVLLFLIFSSYLIAYVRRKRREGRYETLNDGGY